MRINITKKIIIDLLTKSIDNDSGTEDLRSFTFAYFKAEDEYLFESPDIKNFFHVVEDYNTYDEAFGDVNQKFTLLRLRDSLIKNDNWEEELLIAVTRYDRIKLLELQLEEGKIDSKQFNHELRQYCYDNSDLKKVMSYHKKVSV